MTNCYIELSVLGSLQLLFPSRPSREGDINLLNLEISQMIYVGDPRSNWSTSIRPYVHRRRNRISWQFPRSYFYNETSFISRSIDNSVLLILKHNLTIMFFLSLFLNFDFIRLRCLYR